ncbi:MAG: hypothetical protein ACFFGZ_12725 [Candidatus Thorarchaeota archaeon]
MTQKKAYWNWTRPSAEGNSLARQIVIALCVVLALYGTVFELMYILSGIGSQWMGLALLTPALLYFGSSFLLRTIRSFQKLLQAQEQRKKDIETLEAINEIIASSEDPVLSTILYASTQIDDLRKAFAWLTKGVACFSDETAMNLSDVLTELSDNLQTRKKLFNQLKTQAELPSLEDWNITLKEATFAESSAIIRVLSENKSPIAASLLLQTVIFPEPRVRREALSGLRNHYSETITAELLEALKVESDKKTEKYFRYYFYLNRKAINSSDMKLDILNLVLTRWWRQGNPHEQSKAIVSEILPNLSVGVRKEFFPLMLDLISSEESLELEKAILEVLESEEAITSLSASKIWINRDHLMKMREIFRRNPNRESAFERFRQLIAHGALIGIITR